MTVKAVKTYPSSCLTRKSAPVVDFNSDSFKSLVQDLKDTISSKGAHGLAAPQIGVNLRVFVVKDTESGYRVYVNPEVSLKEDLAPGSEGCLSFPGAEEIIERYQEVRVTAKDESGVDFTLDLDGLDAVGIQHELDHLDGKLMIDYMSSVKKRYFLKKVQKTIRLMKNMESKLRRS